MGRVTNVTVPADSERTDLSALGCPAAVLGAIGEGRRESIYGHGFEINLDWWNERINELDLPGGPVRGTRGGETVSDGKARIERQVLFGLADEGRATPDGALALLWHALAWGSGNKLRNNDLRLQAVAADTRLAGEGLRLAAERSQEDAKAAFLVCCPAPRQNLIKYLGPSFATKVLYFAGGGRPEHPCLILDERVATALRDQAGWWSLDPGNFWPADTYERYCSLLHRWSAEESRDDRPICADELERALFELAG